MKGFISLNDVSVISTKQVPLTRSHALISLLITVGEEFKHQNEKYKNNLFLELKFHEFLKSMIGINSNYKISCTTKV